MTLARTGYELHFEEIAPGHPQFGSAAMVSWDTDIFGFPVAVYQAMIPQFDPSMRQSFQTHFWSWMDGHGALLCSCSLPVAYSFWRLCLPDTGFHFVDFTLQVTLSALSKARLPEVRFELRPAEPEDHSAIEAIAAQSFSHGRYHADPLFPKLLADRRYLHWIRRALSGSEPADRVFVLGQPGEVLGFYHFTLEGDRSDLRLAAVAPDFRATMIGVDLYTASLRLLQKLGVRRVVSTISCANAGVMNVYSTLGFRFSDPEIVYHWHAPAFSPWTAK
jgi:ribosomal protein S18 acetylase RimI-like enzyme